jgi:hypothetical protein
MRVTGAVWRHRRMAQDVIEYEVARAHPSPNTPPRRVPACASCRPRPHDRRSTYVDASPGAHAARTLPGEPPNFRR